MSFALHKTVNKKVSHKLHLKRYHSCWLLLEKFRFSLKVLLSLNYLSKYQFIKAFRVQGWKI